MSKKEAFEKNKDRRAEGVSSALGREKRKRERGSGRQREQPATATAAE